MKSLVFISLLLGFLVSCDAPQQRRALSNINSDSLGTPSAGNVSTDFTPTTGSSGTTTGSTTGGSSGSQRISCIKSVTAYHAGLGNIDLCQDTNNEILFKIGFSTTDQSDGTCVVPMYRDNSGNSTWLGSAQCTKHNQGQIVFGNMNKNRNGYSGYLINSVMVMKYSGTNAFFQCMNAYGVSYQSCMNSYGNNPNAQSSCDAQAKNYMTNLCNSFKSSYPYAQVQTR